MKLRKLTNYKSMLESPLTFGHWNTFPIIGYDQESQLIGVRLDDEKSITLRKQDIEEILRQCKVIEDGKWEPE